MSNFITGTLAVGSTGNTSVVSLPFPIKGLVFRISGKYGTTESVVIKSSGSTDNSIQTAESAFGDGTSFRSKAYDDRCVNHIRRVGGVLTEIIKATVVSFDNNGGGDYGFTLNFTAADIDYDITVDIYG